MLQVNRNCKIPETFINFFQMQLMECENIFNFSGPITLFYFYKATFKEAYIFSYSSSLTYWREKIIDIQQRLG